MSSTAVYLQWIDQQGDHIADLVERWSNINSHTYHLAGLEQQRGELVTLFSEYGDHCEVIPVAREKYLDERGVVMERELGPALSIRKRESAPFSILLAIHMDTVYPADHPFQKAVREQPDILHGPGVLDAKGGIAVLFLALQALERTPWRECLGWEVLINADEEIGSPGSGPLLRERASRYRLGLLFEPALADGTFAGARKGSGNFSLFVGGRAAHVGREFNEGRNAIRLLVEFIRELDELNGCDDGVQVNVGRIVGGGPVNVVPAEAFARFNIRVPSVEEQRRTEGFLNDLLRRFGDREGFTLTLHGDFQAPPRPFTPQMAALFSLLEECGRELDLPIRREATGGVCDGNRLSAAGLVNIDTLGPRGGGAHSDREHVILGSILERAKLTALLLMKLASGEAAIDF